jgi:hypothetical protein
MGFQDLDPYGDPAVDVITDIVWSPPITLPGENRVGEKMTGRAVELKLQLANFGVYTTGGYDLTILRNELGYECITGLFQNNSFDPYGEPVVPTGVELFLAIDTASGDTGNLHGLIDGYVDFQIATLQVWENSLEVTNGVWQAAAADVAWVLAFVK